MVLLALSALTLSLITAAIAACPDLPTDYTPIPNTKLTDPFTFVSGQKVLTKEDWVCRQAELSYLFQKFELGFKPEKPASVIGVFNSESQTINVTVTDNDKTISFEAYIQPGQNGKAPYPAIIELGTSPDSLPKPDGVASIYISPNALAHQQGTISRGKGLFYDLYGADHSASAMMAWAWGISRIIDALELSEGHDIDTTKLAVFGCSRHGKGALVVGAFEPRISLTIPSESGTGGSGCWRIADQIYSEGVNVQTAAQIVQENVWLSTSFEEFATTGSVTSLPFDHHLLAALIAPRGLFTIEHSDIEWLGPESTYGCMKTANKVYEALGVPENQGFVQTGVHGHCQFPAHVFEDLDPFYTKFLKGESADTSGKFKTDLPDEAGFVEAEWVDWEVPNLA